MAGGGELRWLAAAMSSATGLAKIGKVKQGQPLRHQSDKGDGYSIGEVGVVVVS